MLLVRVYVDTGLVEPFDPRPYPADWHMHREEEMYRKIVERMAHPVDTADIGDIILFRFGRCYSHGAIIVRLQPLTVVHAYMQARMVLCDEVSRSNELTESYRKPLIYSIWPRS
jgi:hypothetical protein